MKYNSKGSFHLSLIAIRESFVSLVPYLVVSSLAILAGQFIHVFNIESSALNLHSFDAIYSVPSKYFPLALFISLSYHFSIRFNVNSIVSMVLSVLVFFSLESIIHTEQKSGALFNTEASFLIIIIPITTNLLLKYFSLKKTGINFSVNSNINNTFKYIVPFLVVYVASIVFYSACYMGISAAPPVMVNSDFLPNEIIYFMVSTASHILWFLGIHGFNFITVITGQGFFNGIVFGELTYKAFQDTFVVFGGAGSSLSLLLAIFFFAKNTHCLNIAKMSAPFAIFNINEVLIFGLPIVLNRYLFIPFITVPIFNMTLAYFLVPLIPATASLASIPWTTPIFLNAYLIYDESFYIILFQLFLLVSGIFIYRPFVTAFSNAQTIGFYAKKLQKNLDLISPLQSLESLEANKAQASIIRANSHLDSIIDLLKKNSLLIYYQPKVNIKTGSCNEYEALLRLKNPDGHITGPYFLEDIEDAGMASVIDLWVARQVCEDMEKWKNEAFSVKIGVNLHPDTLKDKAAIQEILSILENKNIEFEIIERGLMDESDKKESVLYLKEKGFDLSIDDFGVGYSSLITLCDLPIDSVKLDKSIIDLIHTDAGYKVAKHITSLCHDLGFKCIAEGVETKKQLDILKAINIQYCQGYYFSPAIPQSQVSSYEPRKDQPAIALLRTLPLKN
ncbi:MAG: PTS sugar transporter subunit IIC/EAL domain-containing protein [Gammaproteobacteria bacterium]|nr:PTS sugar transporter subunit IIC/EAL domain-containing protein [Gammaproteobacteria bacterium]